MSALVLTKFTRLKSARIELDLLEALPPNVGFSEYVNAALREKLLKDQLIVKE